MSEVRKTRGEDVFSFHGIDETAEISIVNFGKSCEAIAKFVKVMSSQ